MPRTTHKDLPGGSQDWAAEVDMLMEEVKQLKEVVRRLTENAGLDMANPKRGINTGDTPSIKSPVGQKLSSLADTDTYNVLDKQVLTWSQQGQKWLPVTPTTGGTVDISAVSYSQLTEGYGVVTDAGNYAYNAAGMVPNIYGGPDYYAIENWCTQTQYIGVGDWENSGMALITLDVDGFRRPFINLQCDDYADNTRSSVDVLSYGVRINSPLFKPPTTSTAGRPTPAGLGITNDPGCLSWDWDLGIPIWWNGTTWTNALGTPV